MACGAVYRSGGGVLAAAFVVALGSLCSFARAQTANEAAARADMSALAQGLEIAALDTTFYVSLENLNDVSSANATKPYDSIQDLGGPFVMIPSQGTFLPRRNLATVPVEDLRWRGPYASFPRGTQEATTPYDQGSPVDPWGNAYLLFNPLGLIRGDQGLITQEFYGDSFDRYVIVSLGQDGVQSGDDIPFEFGGGISGTHLTSLSGSGVTVTSPPMSPPTYDVQAGTTITLRGTNFGAAGPGKSVMFGSTVLADVVLWGNREIDVVVPETLAGTNGFRVKIGSGGTNTLQGTITGSDTGIADWVNY